MDRVAQQSMAQSVINVSVTGPSKRLAEVFITMIIKILLEIFIYIEKFLFADTSIAFIAESSIQNGTTLVVMIKSCIEFSSSCKFSYFLLYPFGRCKIQGIGLNRQQLTSPGYIASVYSRIPSPDCGFHSRQQKVIQLTSVGTETPVLPSKDRTTSDNITPNDAGIP